MPCSNAAKTPIPLKFAGVPQTNETISAASGPKFTILSGHVEAILLFNKFFPTVHMCLRCEDIARQLCEMVRRWPIFGDSLRPAFPAIPMQHMSDLHSKFALGPHHVYTSMVDIQSAMAEIRRGNKERRKKERNLRAKI